MNEFKSLLYQNIQTRTTSATGDPKPVGAQVGLGVRNASLMAIIEGGIRISIFILYVLLISLMKDIKRLFMYHGAEHKCINCIERGA